LSSGPAARPAFFCAVKSSMIPNEFRQAV